MEYLSKLNTDSNKLYVSGNTISLHYEVSNPENVKTWRPTNMTIGIGIIIIMTLIEIGVISQLFLVSQNKTIASAYGVSSFANSMMRRS